METIKQAASMEDAINDNFTEVPVTEETTSVEEPTADVVSTTTEEEPATEIPPVAEEPTVEEPTNVEITPIAEPMVKEVVKEVEKPITFKDEQSEKIYKAITEGGEDSEKLLLAYLSNKYTDYGTMSNIDVLKRKIQSEKPHWDAQDIASEIESRYGSENLEKFDLSLVDKDLYPQDYKEQEAHNKEVDRLVRLQERDAKDARVFLESAKPGNVELPHIKKEGTDAPQPTQEQIDEEIRQWNDKVETEMSGFSDLRFKVGNEEIAYKLTEQERNEQKEYMKTLSPDTLFSDLGWVDANGQQNIKKIAEDVHTLKNMQKVIASIGTQMKTVAKKEVLSKDIKNLDLDGKTTTSDAPKQSFADLALGL